MAPADPSFPEPFSPALVVLDFDGTLTDADAHTPAFHAASRQELARLLGWDEETAQREWNRALGTVTRLPAETAWIVNGYPVCPVNVDPYVTVNGVTRLLLREHRPELADEALQAHVLRLFQDAYRLAPSPFRPDAARVLEEVCSDGRHVRVVTNSETAAVERRLDSLGFSTRDRVAVRGNAGKFLVQGPATPDARFDSLPEVAGWWADGRPIHLRRGRYFDALRAIWEETGTTPEQTLLAGDIFELDLAMPAALGVHVHLVLRSGTMAHEVELARAQPRGAAASPLAAVLERVR